MCGRARKCMEAAPTENSVTSNAVNRCAPASTMRRIKVVAKSAISAPAASTIPFNPAQRNRSPSIMSVSHSQAYQGAPGLEKEYKS